MKKKGEQDSFNFLLKRKSFLNEWMHRLGLKKGYAQISKMGRNPYGIRWDFLPDSFLSGGHLTEKIWDPIKPFIFPQNIMIHHANCTTGIENKIIQLKYVRDLVQSHENKVTHEPLPNKSNGSSSHQHNTRA